MKTVLIRNLQNDGIIVLNFEDECIRPVGAGYEAVVYCIVSRHIIRGNRTEHKYKFVTAAGHPEGYPRRQNLNCIRFVHDIAAGGQTVDLLILLRCQEAHADHKTDRKRQRDKRLCGLFVEHPLHALFDAHLTERQRADREAPARHAARKKHARIALFLFKAEALHRPLVARQLQIAAEQAVAQPHRRIEPVDAENAVAKELPDAVAVRFMCRFMRQHNVPLLLRQLRRQIDRRAEKPQQKRRIDRVAQPHALCKLDGRLYAPPEFPNAHQRRKQQRQNADCPDKSRKMHPDLQGIDARRRGRRETLPKRRVHCLVERGNAACDLRLCRILRCLIVEDFLARNQAPSASDGKRQTQPQPRQRP